MRITIRLILSLVVVASAVVCFSAGWQARQERVRLEDDLGRRARVLGESLQEAVEPLVSSGELDGLRRLVNRFGHRERLAGVAVYTADGGPLAMTDGLPATLQAMPEWVGLVMAEDARRDRFLRAGSSRWHGEALPLHRAGRLDGALVVWHEAGYIDAQGAQLWRQNFARLFLHVVLISLTTLVVLQWWLLRPMSRTVEWLRRLRSGELLESDPSPRESVFAPLAREITQLARSLTAARAAATEEARLRHAGESRWTAERLKEQVRTVLQGRPLLVVANREPYLHVRQGRQIRWLMPASGLVTAVEPILRACGGTWVAHGAGDADRETADPEGRLRVPPEEPQYTLRRVWLTKEEEDGYYYRFANEGLWPLCHIAHTRPLFHADDWEQYRRVNAKFAEAVLDELKGTERPCVLIQDYHFALLPRLLKQRRPDAQIALFWHIPWPNPEAFGICPWARDLLHGMLGADLLGFHIQFHCNNFLDTVDRTLESRIDWESFAVNRAGHTTRVKPFPISIAWTPSDETRPPTETLRRKEALLQSLGLQAERLGVGVDRIDYTKGIGERFRAVERLLERYPHYQGAFTFVEIGAPSRTLIPRYHDLGAELEAEADRINRRFQTRTWKPILFLKKHHSHAEIAPFYQAADICLVTSLHDGMNLVAKEFVAAREDRRGVLVLSRFAGASRELRDALVVNPYDLNQVAEAVHEGLAMAPAEQEARMRRMQETLQTHNVYRWAAELVGELAQLRPASPVPATPSASLST